MERRRRSWTVAAVTALILAVGIYAVGAWLAAPWLVDDWLADYRAGSAERMAVRGTIRFNPFPLTLTVTDLELADSPAGVTFSAERLVVDIDVRSLFERRPVISLIDVDAAAVTLRSAGDVAALVDAFRASALGRGRIERLAVSNGRFAVVTDTDAAFELNGIRCSLTGVDGRGDRTSAGRFSLTATSGTGTTVDSSGVLSPGLDGLTGDIAATDVELTAASALLGGLRGLGGRFDLTGDLAVADLASAPAVELNNAAIDLRDLIIEPAPGLTVRSDRLSARANIALALTAAGTEVGGRIEASDAALTISDTRVSPAQSFVFAEADLVATAEARGGLSSLSLAGALAGAGDAMLMIRNSMDATDAHIVSMAVSDLPAVRASAYVAEALGRELSAGRTDLNLDYSGDDERVSGELRVVARDLTFARRTGRSNEPGRPSGQESSPLELAAALLEDDQGVIEMQLQFGAEADSVRDAIAEAIYARVGALTATPFEALSPLVSGDIATVNALPFLPGQAGFNDQSRAIVAQLAELLNARPRLGLRVTGAYDPNLDRQALARQQIQLHVLLATAAPDAQTRPEPIDFGSPRAQDVLDEFAGERLPAERIEQIGRRFACEGPLAELCRRGYYAALFDALVANEDISAAALGRLGRFRAQSVADAMRELGIAPERIDVSYGGDAIDTPLGVGLAVELLAVSLN